MNKKYSNIEIYNLIRKLRDKFKLVNQISYNLSKIDKKFPLEELDTQSVKDLLEVYISFYKELDQARTEILQLLNEENENNENSTA